MQGVAHFLQGPSRSVPGWRQGSRTCSDVHCKGISFTIVRSILRRSTPLGPSPPLLEAPGPSFRTPSPHLPWTPPRTPPWTPSLEPRGWVQGPQKFVEKIVGKFVEKFVKKFVEKFVGKIRSEFSFSENSSRKFVQGLRGA